MNFTFNPLNFVKYLSYMGTGMLTIIIVMGLLIGITVFLNYATKSKKK